MAETSFPWQTGSGTAVDEAKWQAMAGTWLPTGVVGATTRTAADTSLLPSISIGGGGPSFGLTAGDASVLGVRYNNSASLIKTTTNNGSGNPRVDRLVLKMDLTAKTITADILNGTPAGSPAPPSLAGTSTIKYMALARATVAGGGSTYTNLVDERLFVGGRTFIGPSTGTGPALQEGDIWVQTDTDKVLMYDGSTLVDLATRINGTSAQTKTNSFVSTPSASYVALTGDPTAVFVAPASGKVWVHFGARMSASAAGVVSLCAFEVRTGATPGGGSVVYAATDDDAVGEKSTVDGSAARAILVPGLAAGATYHARMLYKQSGSGGADTGGFAARIIGVQPTT